MALFHLVSLQKLGQNFGPESNSKSKGERKREPRAEGKQRLGKSPTEQTQKQVSYLEEESSPNDKKTLTYMYNAKADH